MIAVRPDGPSESDSCVGRNFGVELGLYQILELITEHSHGDRGLLDRELEKATNRSEPVKLPST